MVDHLSISKRSWNMGRIKSKNTRPEKIIRSKLHKLGFRFRIHMSSLPGKPDIVLKKYSTVIFCHGCFWHQHPECKRATFPKSNIEYWSKKLQYNVDHFSQVKKTLENNGWNVIVVWECETLNLKNLERKLVNYLNCE